MEYIEGLENGISLKSLKFKSVVEKDLEIIFQGQYNRDE
jgi:hypothetical protein